MGCQMARQRFLREDFVIGDGAAVSLEHMTVLDVGQCVLNEILMVTESSVALPFALGRQSSYRSSFLSFLALPTTSATPR